MFEILTFEILKKNYLKRSLVSNNQVQILFAVFYHRNNFCNFLFASLGDVALDKWSLLLKERLCPQRRNYFLKELSLKGGKIQDLFPLSVYHYTSIRLDSTYYADRVCKMATNASGTVHSLTTRFVPLQDSLHGSALPIT